jgi:hypothetical protein
MFSPPFPKVPLEKSSNPECTTQDLSFGVDSKFSAACEGWINKQAIQNHDKKAGGKVWHRCPLKLCWLIAEHIPKEFFIMTKGFVLMWTNALARLCRFAGVFAR